MAAGPRGQVMVTGAGGALARRVVRRLQGDFDIVAVDFRARPRLGGNVVSYQGDLNKREFEDVFRRHDIIAVLHLGRMESDESTPERRYNANVLGTQRLFRWCADYGVGQVLVLSTYFVYGASPYNPALLDEEAPLKAAGLTKDLVDSVELESLSNVWLWKHPELHMTVLRPCNIVGPKVQNSMSRLLSREVSPALAGFSPLMQFIHVDDMARAIELSFRKNVPGIYNVAPNEWLPYQDVLTECGCGRLQLPSIPPLLPLAISRLMRWKSFPGYLINYFKYPVLIDGGRFAATFDFRPEHSLDDILAFYRRKKRRAAG